MISKTTQLIEKRINNILFYLCFFITLLALGIVLIQFLSRGLYPSSHIGFFYVGVLLIYAIHKEALRWILDEKEERKQKKGEYFVYLWIVIVALLYLINFIYKDYFRFSPTGQELQTLTEISIIALEVGGVFALTKILKIVAITFVNKK